MMSSLGGTKWKFYWGEEAEAASSEDEDYFGGKQHGYTRDELAERKKKKDAVAEFEAERFRDYKNVKVLRAASHKGLMRSVRPRKGSEVEVLFRTYKTRLDFDSELGLATGGTAPKRVSFVVGAEGRTETKDAELWLPALEAYAVRLRRGECVSSDWTDDEKIEVELVNVRDEREVKRNSAASPWRVDGSVRKKRLAPPKPGPPERATWRDRVEARVATNVADCTESTLDATEFNETLKVTLGAGVHAEGLEAALMAMKKDELAFVTITGELTLTEQQCLSFSSPSSSEAKEKAAVAASTKKNKQTLVVKLDAISKSDARKEPFDKVVEEVRSTKERAKKLFLEGRHRRAEALWTRALTLLDGVAEAEETRRSVEDELVIPLFLNLGQCARKRGAPTDEEVLVTKALVLKKNPDAAFRGKAYVRRAAARIDQGRWAAAKDDLRAATEAANEESNTAVLNDVRRQTARVKELRAERRPDDQRGFFSFSEEKDDRDDEFADDARTTTTSSTTTKKTTTTKQKPPPLLYEKEIHERLRKQKPWDHDPDYDKTQHAPRKPLEPLPSVLKEDDLKGEFQRFDDEDKEDDKLHNMVRQNWVMSNMYDTHGTGRRGMRPKGGGGPGADTFMSL